MKKILILLVLIPALLFGYKVWSDKKKKAAETALSAPVAVATSAPAAAPTPPPPPPPESAAEEKPKPQQVQIDTSAQVVVFCYHRVEGKAGGDLSITLELFEEHLQKLKDNGISVISMQDFLAWKRSEKNIPAKSAIITIDDGYASAYDVARPILRKFGYPWTYFIYTQYVNSGGKSITWKQLEELRDEGVEIGCHTISHQDLRLPGKKTAEEYALWLRQEIIDSKKMIEQKLGIECATFAYPLGRHNPQVVAVVKEAGYAAAFSVYGQRNTHNGSNELVGRYAYYIKRPQDLDLAFSFGGSVSSSAEEAPSAAVAAGAMMITQPMEGEVVHDTQPIIKANLSTMGELDPQSVVIRLSGVGVVPSSYDEESKNIQAKPTKALKAGDYTVILSGNVSGKKVETQWRFRVEPKKP